jgi:uncharacterized protein YcbX
MVPQGAAGSRVGSVRELERAAGRPVNPLRFRANVYFDNVPAWDEFKWMGKELAIGSARLSVEQSGAPRPT